MKTSIFTWFDHDLPFAQAVPLIHAAGFGVIALGDREEPLRFDTSAGREQSRKTAVSNQGRAESVHASFPEGDQLFSLDEGNRIEAVRKCKLAVDASAYLRPGGSGGSSYTLPHNRSGA